eukprot:TRINITY_DN68750_c0_g1_i1.p1 TRINITY_DN68750_c0_g1~~TRINITY_DN68750_c0_g1_i1.p1  ORF type:complete len:198 (+),score=26.15 TRINITY_DN68750_c0_g1_i1:21-614(+)
MTDSDSDNYEEYEEYDGSEDDYVEFADEPPRSSEPAPQVAPEIAAQMATAVKEQGNEKFKAGNYEGALSCYQVAVEHDSTNDVIHSNMAQCCLKLARWKDAEAQADKALHLSSGKNAKAWFRRAQARQNQDNLLNAFYDFKRASILLPADSSIKKAYRQLYTKLHTITPDWQERDTRSLDEHWQASENDKQHFVESQ